MKLDPRAISAKGDIYTAVYIYIYVYDPLSRDAPAGVVGISVVILNYSEGEKTDDNERLVVESARREL